MRLHINLPESSSFWSSTELEEQKEAKAHHEASPWGNCLDPHSDYTAASPASIGSQEEEDMDMEQGASPDEGATGYYETGQDSAFQFEPPRAPAHYGASRNSPGVSEDPHRARSYTPWGADAGLHLAYNASLTYWAWFVKPACEGD